MSMDRGVHDLEDMLDVLLQAGRSKTRVAMADVRDVLGTRAFGPFLVATGLVALTPIGGIPGVPTLMAVIVLLTAGQMLVSKRGFWLPQAILARSVSKEKLERSVGAFRTPARTIDKVIRPRLSHLTQGWAGQGIAVACILLAVSVPFLELVPFAVIAPASAILAFGLALTAYDGLLALIAFTLTGITLSLILGALL